MNGQLNEQPLAEVIREILSRRLVGALRLSHQSVKSIIYFEAGEIVYAASNLRDLRLSEYLKKEALVSPEQLEPLKNKSDLSLAAALADSGAADKSAVNKVIAKQVQDVIRIALLWNQGTWKFEESVHLSDPVRVPLDAPGLLLQAARRMAPQYVVKQLSNPVEIIRPTTGLPDFADLLPAEGFVLSRIEAPTELNELVSLSGLRESDALRTIYGLALGGFVEREYWPSVLKKTPGLIGSPAAGPESGSTPQGSVHLLALELEELLIRLEEATSYYEVLNVEKTASAKEIKSSYYALARRYHPDRFHLHAGTPLHSTIETAFAKIAHAYVTLADPQQRSAYDSKVETRERTRRGEDSAPGETKPAKTEQSKVEEPESFADNEMTIAETNFQEGFFALQQGQIQEAIVSLAAAARLVPGHARFRAYYGNALAAQESTRRLAEAELQVALKLEPKNATYRLMLAELYFSLGFIRRAEGELKRVLAAEPNNPAGLKLERRLKATRSTN